jgi:hypothetical protein
MTDGATQPPLQAAPDPAPAQRKRNPVYAVFFKSATGGWTCMSTNRAAGSRKEAVLAECKANNEPDLEGEFMVIPADAIKHIKRTVKKQTVDEFN